MSKRRIFLQIFNEAGSQQIMLIAQDGFGKAVDIARRKLGHLNLDFGNISITILPTGECWIETVLAGPPICDVNE